MCITNLNNNNNDFIIKFSNNQLFPQDVSIVVCTFREVTLDSLGVAT